MSDHGSCTAMAYELLSSLLTWGYDHCQTPLLDRTYRNMFRPYFLQLGMPKFGSTLGIRNA